MIQTKKSNPNKPPRVLIFGDSGAGKTTFGAKADKPIFISSEGGADLVTDVHGNPVDEVANVKTWDDVRAAVTQLIESPHEFKTLVIDSLDWLEGLAHTKIIGSSGKTIVTADGGYGSAYRKSQNMHQELIRDLDVLREKRGMAVVITAHAHVKPVKDPSAMEDYDSFEIKTHELVSSIFREWCDAVIFVRFRTFTKTGETSKARAMSDGTRVAYTVKQAFCHSKNRYGMPAEMEFTELFWNEFMKYARKPIVVDSVEKILSDIEALRKRVPVHAEAITKSVEDASGSAQKLNAILIRLRTITGQKE